MAHLVWALHTLHVCILVELQDSDFFGIDIPHCSFLSTKSRFKIFKWGTSGALQGSMWHKQVQSSVDLSRNEGGERQVLPSVRGVLRLYQTEEHSFAAAPLGRQWSPYLMTVLKLQAQLLLDTHLKAHGGQLLLLRKPTLQYLWRTVCSSLPRNHLLVHLWSSSGPRHQSSSASR